MQIKSKKVLTVTLVYTLNLPHNSYRRNENDDTLDTVKYWNVIDEEEEKGNRFIDIAKDIAKEEKKVIFSYLGYGEFSDKEIEDIFNSLETAKGMQIGE